MIHPEKKPLVLGIGNDIMGDDAVGLRAARMLREKWPMADIQESYSLGLDLLDVLEGHSCALLLDSIVTYAYTPGTILEIHEAELRQHGRISPHHAGIAESLEVAKILQIPLPLKLTVLAMEVSDPFHFRVGMSPAVEAALPGMVEKAQDLLSTWLGEPMPERPIILA